MLEQYITIDEIDYDSDSEYQPSCSCASEDSIFSFDEYDLEDEFLDIKMMLYDEVEAMWAQDEKSEALPEEEQETFKE